MTEATSASEVTIAPHGGRLVDRVAGRQDREDLDARAREFPRLCVTSRVASDLYMIGVGGFSPLQGFMDSQDYRSVVETMRLADGLPWSLPVTLPVERDQAAGLREGHLLALVNEADEMVGVLELEEKFEYDQEAEAREVYRTTDDAHPGVAALYGQGPVLLAGPVTLIARTPPTALSQYAMEPAETRGLFAEKGWRTVVGFQTRNPVHRAHEYIQKCALEISDGLLLHPLVGETKPDDVPPEVRMECYRVLLEHYYPRDRVVLSVLPAAMRYAGPREAIFHALVRKNYGCTHLIVGRDHAGVGDFYGPYDAQQIFSEFKEDELGIKPLFFDNSFYCRRCEATATTKTCPHGPDDRLTLQGTEVRDLLRRGEQLPPEVSRPEVAQILRDFYNGA